MDSPSDIDIIPFSESFSFLLLSYVLTPFHSSNWFVFHSSTAHAFFPTVRFHRKTDSS
ncbi:hypothetical protein LINPERPRIM_LOCUS23909 [Linum perenne]